MMAEIESETQKKLFPYLGVNARSFVCVCMCVSVAG